MPGAGGGRGPAIENVPLDAAKQKAAQERYVADRQAAQTKLCELVRLGDFRNQQSWASQISESEGGDAGEADLLRRAGDLDGAVKLYQQLIASDRELACASEIPWLFGAPLHFGLAETYRQKRDFDHAIPEYRVAVQLDPKDENRRIVLIDALEDSDDLEAAIAKAKRESGAGPTKSGSTICWAGH